jgi:hypothetical protein
MHNRPELWQAAVYLLMASGCGAIAWKVEMVDWLRLLLVFAAIIFAFLGLFLLIDWVSYETAKRGIEFARAKTEVVRIYSQALEGHTHSAQEKIAALLVIDQNDKVGLHMGKVFVMRTLTLPTGRKIPVELVREYLRASAERGDGYGYPVREHGNARFKNFTDVEKSLRDLVWAFDEWGFMSAAKGVHAAHFVPGVTITDIWEALEL